MKKLCVFILMLACVNSSAIAQRQGSSANTKRWQPKDSVSTFLKIQNYSSFVKKAEANLEAMYMHSLIQIDPQGKPLYLFAWKACMKHNRHPTLADPKFGGVYTATRGALEGLEKSIKNLAYIVNKDLVEFKDENTRKLYLETLDLLVKAHSYLK